MNKIINTMGERHWLHLLNDGKNEMGLRRPVGITFIKSNFGERAESVIKGRVAMPARLERAQVQFKSLPANDSFIVTEVCRACDGERSWLRELERQAFV